LLISGAPINGDKVVAGMWNFGYDPLVVGNPTNIRANAPRSYTTNDKFNYANGVPTPDPAQKFAALVAADIVTKEVLETWVQSLFEDLEIDNGVYENASGTCSNYSVGGGNSDTICPA
jgi:hypothetical protein